MQITDLPDYDNRTASCIIPVRLLIPNKNAGALIGKSGQTIKSIGTQLGVKCYVESHVFNVDRRVMCIKGSFNKVSEAIQCIIRILAQCTKSAEIPKDVAFIDDDNSTIVSLTILVPDHLIGAVIGIGGNTVSGLRKALKVGIRVSNTTLPHSSEKTIDIEGEAVKVHLAAIHVLYEVLVRVLKTYKDDYLAKLSPHIPYVPRSENYQNLVLPGPLSQIFDPQFFGSQFQPHSNPEMLKHSNPELLTHSDPNQYKYQMLRPHNEIILVSESMIPLLRGHIGSTLAQICSASGTNIQFLDVTSDDDQNLRSVLINGTFVGVKTAVTLIAEILSKANQSHQNVASIYD